MEDRRQFNDQINQLNNTLTKARNLLLSEAIDASDYRLIKTETEGKIQRLEAKLSAVPADQFSPEKLIDKASKCFFAPRLPITKVVTSYTNEKSLVRYFLKK